VRCGDQLILQLGDQAQADGGISSRIPAASAIGTWSMVFCRAFADQLFNLGHLVAQAHPGQVFKPRLREAGLISHSAIIVSKVSGETVKPCPFEHQVIIFEVMASFADLGVSERTRQGFKHLLFRRAVPP
jgi:hypothetical protein